MGKEEDDRWIKEQVERDKTEQGGVALLHNAVDHPKHYCSHPSGLECIEVAQHLNFCLGNAFKYLFRRERKNSCLEDLEKAKWYIQKEIDTRSLEERWEIYPKAPEYEVSTLGRLRRIDSGKIRKLVPIKGGYYTFILGTKKKGYSLHYIHRAVIETFRGPIGDNVVIRHLNGNKADNCLSNLLPGTAKENRADTHFHGTSYDGARNPSVKLTSEQVAEIIGLFGAYSEVQVAAMYNVSRATIGRIWRGESWSEKAPRILKMLDSILTHEENNNIKEAYRFLVPAMWSKTTIEDLEKAKWYIQCEIDRIKGEK